MAQKSIDTLHFVEEIYRKSFVFVLSTLEYAEQLQKVDKSIMGSDLIQSATLWGEYINDARSMTSLQSIKYKFRKALHQADRLMYFFNLCRYSKDYPNPDNLIENLIELRNEVEQKTN